MTRGEFLARLGVAAALMPVAHYLPLLWHGGTLVWLAAAIVALVFVFCGELLIDAFTGAA